MTGHTRNAILGIAAYYHDSAAALIIDGRVVAAAQEERFTRIKNDESFPYHAARFVLAEYGLKPSDLDAIVFYEKPLLKFERLLETYHRFAPRGVISFIASMPIWIKEKLFIRRDIWQELERIEGSPLSKRPPLLFPEHHLSHAASAFYPSPFEDAAILTIDGVGEWATASIGHGSGKNISMVREMRFPHSLGLLYSAFTYYCGFKINSGEYKLMGLAPYGDPKSPRVSEYKEKILNSLISLHDDGSLTLTMSYFTFATTLRTVNDAAWTQLFGIPPRHPESPLTQEYMDMALAIQEVTNDAVVRMARTAHTLTGSSNLVLAGGVALNCVANHALVESKIFKNIWIQPAAGDAGGAVGAALAAYYIWFDHARTLNKEQFDAMSGSYLGPEYSALDIERMARTYEASYYVHANRETLYPAVAQFIADGNVVGWMQGKMEWGPRSLGNRSILADPRSPEMQKKLNLKIKYRESFRPFAPSVLEEDSKDYFEMKTPSPYMLFTTPVVTRRRTQNKSSSDELSTRLNTPRSDIPSVTHLDYSARIQTVSKKTNMPFWELISAFKALTGYGLLVNTSFNVRGEPIVMTPEDAYRCFMNTEMDYLVIGNYVFDKKEQPKISSRLKTTYGLD